MKFRKLEWTVTNDNDVLRLQAIGVGSMIYVIQQIDGTFWLDLELDIKYKTLENAQQACDEDNQRELEEWIEIENA